MSIDWEIPEGKYERRLSSALKYYEAGKMTKSIGLVFEAHLPGASVGSICRIIADPSSGVETGIDGEVIGFREKRVIIMPYEEVQGVNHDSQVVLQQRVSTIQVGRVIDGRGRPIDGGPPLTVKSSRAEERSLYRKPSDPVKRALITQPLDLGVKSVNGLVTTGKGQRVGIFAGSGVGKSVLLGMMARNTAADVNVIALVGERGREVREFIERDLGEEGLKNSVVVVATADQSPLLRMRAAFLGATIAEFFRDQERDVLFMMDSLTRFSMAQREISLSDGEPPASKGYPPSVFSTLPKLLERSGTSPGKGSITGLYTVLVEGDDLDEPIADAAKSILDGHIVLSRALAEKNHYPAVDVLQSTSRVMTSVITSEQKEWAAQMREWLAVYHEAEDLINIGAYVKGSNPKIDQAVAVIGHINRFLRQRIEEPVTFQQTLAEMHSVIRAGEAFSASSDQQNLPNEQTVDRSRGFAL